MERRCDLKWCPACQRGLAARTSIRYAKVTEELKWPLFVTLTTQNFEDSEKDFLREIRKSFGRLRRLRWFRACVSGGVASIEVTNTGNGWHPHVHALLDAKWFSVTTKQPGPRASRDQWRKRGRQTATEIAEQWSLCLRRPGSVKIRRVWEGPEKDARPVTTEVLKYSVKGSDLLECEDAIAPVIRMLDRCRLVTSWGSMYGHPAAKRPRSCGLPCGNCGGMGTWLPEHVALAGWRV